MIFSMKRKPEDQYRDKEAQALFEAALRRTLDEPPSIPACQGSEAAAA
jgi:hypothetical protein